jgi:hypothetical protein
MNVWILTIGSSDVQLKPKNNWTNLYRSGRSQLKPDRGFSPSKLPDSDCLRVPARVMGVIYSQPQASLDDLEFPLVDNFINKLKTQQLAIDKVILVLSDQSVFPEIKRGQKHPYWQDTCTLQPILKNYLTERWKDVSPTLEIQPLLLEAASEEEGLDNWDAVLKLVQRKFTSSDLNFPADTIVYVSHQAGTPAISSAVQFCCLAKFGDLVKFLVSNEYNPRLPEKPLEGSSYLRGIKIQEAKALLDSYNYAGLEALIKGYVEDNEDVRTLLSAAKNWNVAKFGDFLKGLTDHPKFISDVAERERKGNWWWISYEEAYLAVIREKQDNIVEAFFHSFRSFEGIFAAWGNREFGDHIYEFKGIPHLDQTILNDPKRYFLNLSNKKSRKSIVEIYSKLEKLKAKSQNPEEVDERVELDFSTLCKLFRAFRYSDYTSNCSDLKIFWDDDKQKNVSSHRNNIVHQVNGMSKKDLWNFWHITAPEESDKVKDRLWEEKLLKFLNFIVKNDVPEGFTTLEEASLMVKVHQELEKAISNL